MLTVKRGATIIWFVEWEGATLESLKSQIRDDFGRLIAEFDIYEHGEDKFLFVCDTSNFPIATLLFDIKQVYEGRSIPTNTVKLKIVKEVTV